MGERPSLADWDPDEGIPNEFVYRVGWVAVSWAMVEYGLDSAIREIYQIHDGASVETRIPVSLNPKIAFLRKAFNQVGGLAGCAVHGHALLDEVNALKHQRHDIMHGIIAGPGDEGYQLMRFRYEATGHVREIYAYTMEDLSHLSRHASSLAERLSFFLDLIIDDQAEEALRELAVGKPAVPIPKKKLFFDAS